MASFMQNVKFENANQAFKYFYKKISEDGYEFDNTKALFNVGFYIMQPDDNHITDYNRGWKHEYAEAEWQWYLSGDQSIDKLGDIYGSIPPIWERMAIDRKVNSNYGWQWKRDGQLEAVIEMLRDNPQTRQAAISIYDGKEIGNYANDTPCTYAVQFSIIDGTLNIAVTMRSNDLWYGFCNDQYCFSELQKLVAERLNLPVGRYYHFAHNLHIYNHQLLREKQRLFHK